MAYLRFELLLSEVGWSGDVLVTLSGSHVVIRESGRPRRGIATWTRQERFWLSSAGENVRIRVILSGTSKLQRVGSEKELPSFATRQRAAGRRRYQDTPGG